MHPNKNEAIEAVGSQHNRKTEAHWKEVRDRLWEDDSQPYLTARSFDKIHDSQSSAAKLQEKAEEKKKSPSFLVNLWNWMVTPLSFGAPPPVVQTDTSVAPVLKVSSSPLETPTQIDRAQLNRFVAEMKEMLQQIAKATDVSADELMEEYYHSQALLYKMGIRTAEAEFVRKKEELKATKLALLEKNDEIKRVSVNAGWWGGFNNILKGVTTVAFIALPLVFRGNPPPNAGLNVGTLLTEFLTAAPLFLTIFTAATAAEKAILDRKLNMQQGDSLLLRTRITVVNHQSRDNLDQVQSNWKAFWNIYKIQVTLANNTNETVHFINSQQS